MLLLVAGCVTAPKPPRALSASEVASLASPDDLTFHTTVRAERQGDALSLHVTGPHRCPRGQRHDDGDTPRFEFALVRCDEEAGERMLFSIDGLALSVDGHTPMDPRARVPITPSVSHASVPVSALTDTLALVLDAGRAKRVLGGERVVLLAEGGLVHRDGRTTRNWFRQTVVVSGFEDELNRLAMREAARVARPLDVAIAGDDPTSDPSQASGHRVDVTADDDVASFVALVEKRCKEGERPVLAVSGQDGARDVIHFVSTKASAPFSCDVVVLDDAREAARTYAERARPPAIAIGFDQGAVLVFVDETAP